MLMPGALLQNRYHILRQIGGGGFGVVYQAEDNRLPGRHYAIKEMSPTQLPSQDLHWAIDAFQQEATMLANLNHPGLTDVTDFFPEGNNWYLVMEYVAGQTLRDRLEQAREGRLSLNEALDITRQLCDVLDYLHSQSPPVVFRDLKPGNVMITPQGEIRLIDFGIARFFKPEQTRDTINLGTPGYAAPEQYGGRGQSDPRADIYSLGALLLQMVTGYDPVTAVTPFPLPPPGSLRQGLPVHVEQVISQATQIQPERRQRSVKELRRALFPPVQTVQPSRIPTQSPYELPEPRSQALAKWRKAAWLGLGGAGVVFLGLCVVLAVWLRPWSSYLSIVPPADGTPSPNAPAGAESGERVTATQPQTSTPSTGAQMVSPSPIPAGPSATSALLSIAFDSYRDGHWEVYLMDENGLNTINLTNHPANDGDPAWSFDGKHIAFDSDRDGNWEIYMMNADGSEVTRLTNHPAKDDVPNWSPDGSRVAFQSDRDGNWEVYVVKLDGLSVTNLTNDPADDWAASWSPNGQRIAFVSDRTGDWDIWTVGADGSDPVDLTNHPAKDAFPSWAPDGQRIAFYSYRDNNAEVYVMNADGSGLARLTNHPAEDWGASWSPDALRLAFASDRDGDNEIYIMDVGGGSVVQLTYNQARDTWPVWSPAPNNR